MDLWRLQIFCKVVENKSFSKAGKSIHLSQPTVSSHMKDLEEHFGCRLIDRMGKEAIPTQAGEILYVYARKLISLRDQAESAMAEFQGKMKGRLLIGGSTIPGGYLLPKIIGEFSEKYPEVTVSLIIGDTEKIIGNILSGEVELGIVGAKTAESRIEQKPFFLDEIRIIVHKENKWRKRKRIHLEELKKEPFILREKGSGTRKSMEEIFSKNGFGIQDLNVVAEMGNTVSVIQAIKNRIGVSIVSTAAVEDELAAKSLFALSIEGCQLSRYLYLTRHRHRTLSPLGEAFDMFLDQYSEKP